MILYFVQNFNKYFFVYTFFYCTPLSFYHGYYIALYTLFTPRPPLECKPKMKKRKCLPYTGIAAFIDQFEQGPPPKRVKDETHKEKKERLNKEKLDIAMQEVELARKSYRPQEKSKMDSNFTENALNTLFVGRLSYDVTERKLRREFEVYGPVKKITVINDKEGNPRGYAFVEYENERDMKAAYDNADGKKLEDRRIVVDCERGRTVKGWYPRRLAGGKGGRKDKPALSKAEKRAIKEQHRRREADERRRERYAKEREARGYRDDYDQSSSSRRRAESPSRRDHGDDRRRSEYGDSRGSDRYDRYSSSRYDDRRDSDRRY
jgi:U1 small nuclear ribonucleoprotein